MYQDAPIFPPIFSGHVGLPRKESNDHDDVYEILLAAPCLIEGLHVVPNAIALPQYNLVGQTLPERGTRSFSLKLYGRDVSNGNSNCHIVEIFDLMICGGVQWVRIPPQYQTTPFNYIAITGDFSVVTLIIHGSGAENSNGLLSPLKKRLPDFVAMFPSSNLDQSLHSSLPTSDEEIFQLIGLESTSSESSKPDLISVPYASDNSLLQRLYDHRNQQNLRCDHLEKRFHSKCLFSPECLVSLSTIGVVVENIFSIDISAIVVGDGSFSNNAEYIKNFHHALAACWQSSENCRGYPIQGFDSVSACLGDEAAIILGEICVKLVNALAIAVKDVSRQENDRHLAQGSLDVWGDILAICNLVLQNGFTTRSIRQPNDLMQALMDLFKCRQLLSEDLAGQVVKCLVAAQLHTEFSDHFLLVPSDEGDESLYQLVLHAARTLESTDPLAALTSKIVNWNCLVDGIRRLRVLSESIVGSRSIIEELAQIVPLWASMCKLSATGKGSSYSVWDLTGNASFAGDDMQESESVSFGSAEDEHRARLEHMIRDGLFCVEEAAGLLSVITRSVFILSKWLCESAEVQAAFFSVLENFHLLASLTAVASLEVVLEELDAISDWRISASMHVKGQSLRQVLQQSRGAIVLLLQVLVWSPQSLVSLSRQSHSVNHLIDLLIQECPFASDFTQLRLLDPVVSDYSTPFRITSYGLLRSSCCDDLHGVGWLFYARSHIAVAVNDIVGIVRTLRSADDIHKSASETFWNAVDRLWNISKCSSLFEVVITAIYQYGFVELAAVIIAWFIHQSTGGPSADTLGGISQHLSRFLVDCHSALANLVDVKCISLALSLLMSAYLKFQATEAEVPDNAEVFELLVSLVVTGQQLIDSENLELDASIEDIKVLNMSMFPDEKKDSFERILSRMNNIEDSKLGCCVFLQSEEFIVESLRFGSLLHKNRIAETTMSLDELCANIKLVAFWLNLLRCYLSEWIHCRPGELNWSLVAKSFVVPAELLTLSLISFGASNKTPKDMEFNFISLLNVSRNAMLYFFEYAAPMLSKYLLLIKVGSELDASKRVISEFWCNLLELENMLSCVKQSGRLSRSNVDSTQAVVLDCLVLLPLTFVFQDVNFDITKDVLVTAHRQYFSQEELLSRYCLIISRILEVYSCVAETRASSSNWLHSVPVFDEDICAEDIGNKKRRRVLRSDFTSSDLTKLNIWSLKSGNPANPEIFAECRHPLYQLMVEENVSLGCLLLRSMVTSCKSLHSAGVHLAGKLHYCSSKSVNEIAQMMVKLMTLEIQQQCELERLGDSDIARMDNEISPLGESELKQLVLEIRCSNLSRCCRILDFLSQFTSSSVFSVIALIMNGVLKPILAALNSNQAQLVCLSLNCCRTILKVLHQTSLMGVSTNLDSCVEISLEFNQFFKIKIQSILLALSSQLSLVLDSLVSRSQNWRDSQFVWFECSYLLPYLSLGDIVNWLHGASTAVRIEAFAVRLWQHFEDAYQALIELTEVRRFILSSSSAANDLLKPEACESALNDAHNQLALAVQALNCAVGSIVMMYESGKLNLIIVAKCVRWSLGDCKKICIRFQRNYTMWASHFATAIKVSDSGDDAMQSILFGGSIDFQSRHASIVKSLRTLVENLTRISRCISSKDDKSMNCPDAKNESSDWLAGESIDEFICHPFRLSNGDELEDVDCCQILEYVSSLSIQSEWDVFRQTGDHDAMEQFRMRSALFGFGLFSQRLIKDQESLQNTESSDYCSSDLFKLLSRKVDPGIHGNSRTIDWSFIGDGTNGQELERQSTSYDTEVSTFGSSSRKRSRFTSLDAEHCESDVNYRESMGLTNLPPVGPPPVLPPLAPTLALAPSLSDMLANHQPTAPPVWNGPTMEIDRMQMVASSISNVLENPDDNLRYTNHASESHESLGRPDWRGRTATRGEELAGRGRGRYSGGRGANSGRGQGGSGRGGGKSRNDNEPSYYGPL